MKRVSSALILSAAIVAASALPALAGEPDPLATAKTHVDELPVDVSIGIIRTPGDVSGSIDVTVSTPGTDRTTHVDLPPLRGGDHAGTPDDHASDRAFDHAPGVPDDHADAHAFDHVPTDTPTDPAADVTPDTAAGTPAELPAAPETLPDGALDHAPADLPAAPADLPAAAPTDLPPTDVPPTDVVPELPAEVPTGLPSEPASLPPDVPSSLPAAGPLAH